ncbi:MAG TPA: BadF/BadG/BcrA/BcrD ATPase family protein, partial [Terriglobales bacterium]|nr:BadF/BadG/BcrA/BcrD ATPase family protein [Terriglobales bacterium]
EKVVTDPKQISQTCIGVAGAARTPVVNSIRQVLEELVGGGIEVVGDMVIALESAFGTGPGMIMIAGTGSICFGRDSRGETARAGGWGPEISDEGSGTWIGRQAVSRALRAHDAGQHTALLPALLSSWGVASRDELSQKANSSPPPDFSLLSSQVFEAARSCDQMASAILDQAGLELAELASVVAHRLWPARQNMQLAFTGGVLLNSEHVRVALLRELKARLPEAEVLNTELDPVAGAVVMARRAWSRSSAPQGLGSHSTLHA